MQCQRLLYTSTVHQQYSLHLPEQFTSMPGRLHPAPQLQGLTQLGTITFNVSWRCAARYIPAWPHLSVAS